MLHVWVYLCPLEYRGCVTPGGWMTPQKTCICRGFGAAVNHHSVAASSLLFCNALYVLWLDPVCAIVCHPDVVLLLKLGWLFVWAATTTVLRAFRAEGAATSARFMNFCVAVSGPSHRICFHQDTARSRDGRGRYLSLTRGYLPILRDG